MHPAVLGIGWVTASTLGSGKNVYAFKRHPGNFSTVLTNTRLDPAYPRLGRMDGYSRAALFAIALAMKDAGLDGWGKKRSIGVIAATCSGCMETDVHYYRGILIQEEARASPHLFAYTLPSTFIGDASIYLGLTGPGFVIQKREPLSLTGLALALDALFQREARHMVIGACDAGILPPFGSKKDANPYALFMVIGEPSPGRKIYGEVETSKVSGVRFRGEPVKDLLEMLHACGSCLPDRAETCPARSSINPEESVK